MIPPRSRDDDYLKRNSPPKSSSLDSTERLLMELPMEGRSPSKDRPLTLPRHCPSIDDELPSLKECSYSDEIETHPIAALLHNGSFLCDRFNVQFGERGIPEDDNDSDDEETCVHAFDRETATKCLVDKPEDFNGSFHIISASQPNWASPVANLKKMTDELDENYSKRRTLKSRVSPKCVDEFPYSSPILRDAAKEKRSLLRDLSVVLEHDTDRILDLSE